MFQYLLDPTIPNRKTNPDAEFPDIFEWSVFDQEFLCQAIVLHVHKEPYRQLSFAKIDDLIET